MKLSWEIYIMWNQPPKKAVAPACANDMTFIKPSFGDDPQAESSQQAHSNIFEPYHIEHCTLHKESLRKYPYIRTTLLAN